MKKKKYAPTLAFHDGDPCVYAAAFAVEKNKYFFEDAEGNRVSQTFHSAKKAKEWLRDETMSDFEFNDEVDLEANHYVRKSFKAIGTVEEAIKAADEIVKDYKKLAGKSIKKHTFYLTASGDKHKKNQETEKEYQYNRKDSVRPIHYEAVRKYLESLPEFKIAPKGFEADNILCALGQRHGEKAVVLSLDKDMGTMENAWFIHVNRQHKGKPKWCTSLGELWFEGANLRGTGFKWLSYQAIAGDACDGYHGLKGVGKVRALELIDNCNSKEEIVKALIEYYKVRYPEGIKYTSWAGIEMELNSYELLEQHYNLAYMEKSAKDSFTIKGVLNNG